MGLKWGKVKPHLDRSDPPEGLPLRLVWEPLKGLMAETGMRHGMGHEHLRPAGESQDVQASWFQSPKASR